MCGHLSIFYPYKKCVCVNSEILNFKKNYVPYIWSYTVLYMVFALAASSPIRHLVTTLSMKKGISFDVVRNLVENI